MVAETRGHEEERDAEDVSAPWLGSTVRGRVRQTAVISETFHVEQTQQDTRYLQLRDAYYSGLAPAPYEGWRVTGYATDFDGSLVTVTLRVEEPG